MICIFFHVLITYCKASNWSRPSSNRFDGHIDHPKLEGFHFTANGFPCAMSICFPQCFPESEKSMSLVLYNMLSSHDYNEWCISVSSHVYNECISSSLLPLPWSKTLWPSCSVNKEYVICGTNMWRKLCSFYDWGGVL